MLPWDIPDGPWQEIAANYCQHKGKVYLLICDLFSKYPFLFKVTSKSALLCPKTLSTSQDVGTSLEDLLLDLWSTPIGPKILSPREILHNRMIQHPGRSSTPVNMEEVWNHLITKKKTQKQYFDKAHNVKSMSQLDPSQEVLFLSWADQCFYIPGTIINKASTP